MRPLALLCALLLSLAAKAADPGYATRDLELRAEPVSGAAVVGTLQKGARFEIVGEKGAWSNVAAGSVKGWALSFYVMKGEPAAQVSLGTRLGEVVSLGTERRAETSGTLGVRGLDEEQLRSAQFNAQELQRLEALGETRAAAETFAKRGSLMPRAVAYLPDPGAPAQSAQPAEAR
ncbi:MAG: SH3 domain-containing protein [Clostridia bacterium]